MVVGLVKMCMPRTQRWANESKWGFGWGTLQNLLSNEVPWSFRTNQRHTDKEKKEQRDLAKHKDRRQGF